MLPTRARVLPTHAGPRWAAGQGLPRLTPDRPPGPRKGVFLLLTQSVQAPERTLSVAFLVPFSPRLTVIVVKKRVNARFFAQSGGRLQNPLPGTVIDVEVTRPEW